MPQTSPKWRWLPDFQAPFSARLLITIILFSHSGTLGYPCLSLTCLSDLWMITPKLPLEFFPLPGHSRFKTILFKTRLPEHKYTHFAWCHCHLQNPCLRTEQSSYKNTFKNNNSCWVISMVIPDCTPTRLQVGTPWASALLLSSHCFQVPSPWWLFIQ